MRTVSVILLSGLLITGGCAGPLAGRLTLPERHTVVRDQLEIHGDFALAKHHRLFEELTAQREVLCRRLSLPRSDEPIHVYLFEDPERYGKFMRLNHPDFPDRRAFFVETDSRLIVYAQWGDRMAEDLRHEVTHGYVHAVVPNIPLWIDEGIAEYFEVPRGQSGVNRQHLKLLAELIDRGGWRPDLRRLEQLSDAREMTQYDYAESWAWVHFLLDSRPECREASRGYLAELRSREIVVPISVRLKTVCADPEAELLGHVIGLISALSVER